MSAYGFKCILQGVGDKRESMPSRLRSWPVLCISEGGLESHCLTGCGYLAIKKKGVLYGDRETSYMALCIILEDTQSSTVHVSQEKLLK